MDEGNAIPEIKMQEITLGFRFCPKCGSNALKTMGSRAYRCEECQLIYFINNSAAVACLIFNAEGELLLTRRAVEPNKGMLDLPGGFVDPLESVEEAISREIKEELNLTIVKADYLISFPNLYPFSGLVIPTADLAFVCKAQNFNELKVGDDVASVEFVKPELIKVELLCSESMKQILMYYLSQKDKIQNANNVCN